VLKDDDADFGMMEDDDGEDDGEDLLKFTQYKNSKKHDFIPRRTRKINTERGVVKAPSDKKKKVTSYLARKCQCSVLLI
jgi:hypothetical protein